MQRIGWEWTHAGDAELEASLRAELDRLRCSDARTALGLAASAGTAEARAAFLRATKRLHPSRFARRNADVLRLANEVFLCIKVAYEELMGKRRAGRAVAASPRAGVSRAASTGPVPRVARPRAQATAAPAAAPSGVDEELGRALTLCVRGQWAEGILALQMLAAAHPGDLRIRAHVHYAQGQERESLGDISHARAEYERALAIEPSLGIARRALDALPRPSGASRPRSS